MVVWRYLYCTVLHTARNIIVWYINSLYIHSSQICLFEALRGFLLQVTPKFCSSYGRPAVIYCTNKSMYLLYCCSTFVVNTQLFSRVKIKTRKHRARISSLPMQTYIYIYILTPLYRYLNIFTNCKYTAFPRCVVNNKLFPVIHHQTFYHLEDNFFT